MSIPAEQYRFLGRTGLRVSSISLGGWITFGAGMQVDDDRAYEIFETAYNKGINFFDVAEEYGNGACETSVGKILKRANWRRDTYVLSTKLFWGFSRSHVNALGLSRKHIMEGCRASLERLQQDYVDIVYAHRPDKYTPMEEVVRGFTQLINDGKAFYWGTSMWSAYEIEHAQHIATKHGLIAPVVEQPCYNMLDRDNFEKELAPIFKEYGYGSTVFSPLATGLLTGKYNSPDNIPADSRYAPEARNSSAMISNIFNDKFHGEQAQANFKRLQGLQKVCDKLNVKMAALALAWLLNNKNVTTVIIGASKPEQIELNLQAYDVLPLLTEEVCQEIEKALNNKPGGEDDAGRLGNF